MVSQLKKLFDVVGGAKSEIPAKVWEKLSGPMQEAGTALFTTRTFEYRGRIKNSGRTVLVKLLAINMDFDDLIRIVCNKPDGNIDQEVELTITVFDGDKPKDQVTL